MFIKNATLRKWCKIAHKAGCLSIGSTEKSCVISTGAVWLELTTLTNEQKGIVVTFAGEIPPTGQMWNTATGNYFINDWIRAFSGTKIEKLELSPLIIERNGVQKYRVLINAKNELCFAIPELICEEITEDATLPDESDEIELYHMDDMVVWENDKTKLGIHIPDVPEIDAMIKKMKDILRDKKGSPEGLPKQQRSSKSF